jgi:hypothetical protein
MMIFSIFMIVLQVCSKIHVFLLLRDQRKRGEQSLTKHQVQTIVILLWQAFSKLSIKRSIWQDTQATNNILPQPLGS